MSILTFCIFPSNSATTEQIPDLAYISRPGLAELGLQKQNIIVHFVHQKTEVFGVEPHVLIDKELPRLCHTLSCQILSNTELYEFFVSPICNP